MLVKYQANLKRKNSFQVQATAHAYVQLDHLNDLEKLDVHLQSINDKEKKLLLLGEGTNCLFNDLSQVIVVNLSRKGVSVVKESKDHYWVKVAAGENWDEFVEKAVHNRWYGLENLSYIPGSVGASPVQNIGAYGVEVGEKVAWVEGYCLTTKKALIFKHEECEFAYRDSIFKKALKNTFIITAVCFRLEKQFLSCTSYAGIADAISERGMDSVDAQGMRDIVINIRKQKLPDHKNEPNAGSFFKNPVVDDSHFQRLKTQFPEIPNYSLNHKKRKIPAAWLIENAGLKGFEDHRCKVSEKQPLVLVNHKEASGEELLKLAAHVRETVRRKYNILLVSEVNVIGS